MIEIVPAILAKTEEEFREKIEIARSLSNIVHIDVMDGKFVKETTWAVPEKMKEILGDLAFEAHLMTSEPEHEAMVWLAAGASRVYYHAEASARDELILKSALDRSDRVGIAINPDTPLSRITHVIDRLQRVLVMGVTPGRSGQPFQPIAVEKIAALKNLRPSLKIAVDGGIRPENAAALVRAGADALIAATALTDAKEPMLAVAKFKEIIDEACSTPPNNCPA